MTDFIEEFDNAEIKISVIMPIYNACDYLRPALDSIIDQTVREIEIICVDDGSTDHSLGIITEYQKRDNRIRIVTETNAGPSMARNNGLRRARGEYVAFLDADDFFEPDLLEKMYEIAKRDDLDIAIVDYDFYNSKKACFRENVETLHSGIYDGGVVTSKNEHPDTILQSTTGSAWNKLFKRSFLVEKNITFPQEIMMFEDVYFTVCALAFAERVGKYQKVLLHHRVYSEQSRARLFKKYFAQVPLVYLEIKNFLMKGGMYEPLAKGYLNLSVSRCYQIYGMLWSDAREDFWNMLHKEYAEKLGWAEKCKESFERPELCEFCANVQMYDHDQYVKRCRRGLRVKLDNIVKTVKQSQRWEKFKSFFARKNKNQKTK